MALTEGTPNSWRAWGLVHWRGDGWWCGCGTKSKWKEGDAPPMDWRRQEYFACALEDRAALVEAQKISPSTPEGGTANTKKRGTFPLASLRLHPRPPLLWVAPQLSHDLSLLFGNSKRHRILRLSVSSHSHYFLLLKPFLSWNL